jgi:hypothetical protein
MTKKAVLGKRALAIATRVLSGAAGFAGELAIFAAAAVTLGLGILMVR